MEASRAKITQDKEMSVRMRKIMLIEECKVLLIRPQILVTIIIRFKITLSRSCHFLFSQTDDNEDEERRDTRANTSDNFISTVQGVGRSDGDEVVNNPRGGGENYSASRGWREERPANEMRSRENMHQFTSVPETKHIARNGTMAENETDSRYDATMEIVMRKRTDNMNSEDENTLNRAAEQQHHQNFGLSSRDVIRREEENSENSREPERNYRVESQAGKRFQPNEADEIMNNRGEGSTGISNGNYAVTIESKSYENDRMNTSSYTNEGGVHPSKLNISREGTDGDVMAKWSREMGVKNSDGGKQPMPNPSVGFDWNPTDNRISDAYKRGLI